MGRACGKLGAERELAFWKKNDQFDRPTKFLSVNMRTQCGGMNSGSLFRD